MSNHKRKKFKGNVRPGPAGKDDMRLGGAKKKTFFLFFVLLVVIFGIIGLVLRSKDNDYNYNVIFICIDTLRADHLGCYDYEKNTSPNIDAFAKTSVFFENSYSTTSWTFPSHFSMFTSRYPNKNDLLIYPAVRKFSDSYITLAEQLKSAGYKTAAFAGGGWMAKRFGYDQGFNTYVSYGRRFEDNQPAVFNWLAKHTSKKFFLFIHGFNTHRPYDAPGPIKKKFTEEINMPDECRGITFADKQRAKFACLEAENGVAYLNAVYDAEIFYVDILMKQLFDELKKHNLYENSIIIITSDHGEELSDHGRMDHVKTVYQEVIKVPLMIRLPGSEAKTVKSRVSNLNLLPTVLDVLGISYEKKNIHGKSMRDLINGQEEDSNIFALTGLTGKPAIDNEGIPYILLSATHQNFKLILKIRQDKSRSYELYDLEKDPHEKNNLAAEARYKTEVALLNAMIDDWAQKTNLQLDLYEAKDTTSELDEETLKQLKSLGYLN
jgi:arylsulfatase A-like enzyme